MFSSYIYEMKYSSLQHWENTWETLTVLTQGDKKIAETGRLFNWGTVVF